MCAGGGVDRLAVRAEQPSQASHLDHGDVGHVLDCGGGCHATSLARPEPPGSGENPRAAFAFLATFTGGWPYQTRMTP